MLLLFSYFFLLACFTKRFASLHLEIASFPLYVSEMILGFCLIFRAREIYRCIFQLPKPVLYFWALYMLWGAVELARALLFGAAAEMGLQQVLRDSCVVYQSLWFLLVASFSLKEWRLALSAAFAGIGTAQVLGWIGFATMGHFNAEHGTLIGVPVGNEVVNPLYPLAFAIWNPIASSLLALTFGLSWITQFLLYFKRTWVFSILFFVLPVLWIALRGQQKKVLLAFLGTLILGPILGLGTVKMVSERLNPPVTHRAEWQGAQDPNQLPVLVRGFFDLVSAVFPFQAEKRRGTQVSAERVFFHGESPEALESPDLGAKGFMAFRLFLWKQTWEGFLEKPVLGQGFGPRIALTQLNGQEAVVDGKWISGPHNSFLTIAFRLGLVGLLLFFGFIFSTIYYAWKRGRRDPRFPLALAIFLCVNFFALFNVCLENPQSGIWYWSFLGALAIFARFNDDKKASSDQEHAADSNNSRVVG